MDARGDLSWDEVHHAIIPLMRADNRTNVAYLLREYVALVTVLCLCGGAIRAWSDGQLTTLLFTGLAIMGVTAVAILQHRLAGLAHDASHYVLFRNALANELASDLLCLFPLVAMTQSYRGAHLGHHRYVNDPIRDPDLIRLNHRAPVRFPMSRIAFWWRYVVRSLWPPALWGYLFGRAVAANRGAVAGPPLRGVYRARVARCLRGAYWLSVLSMVHISHGWAAFGLFWVVPLLTVYPFLMQLREVAHHSNAPDNGDWTNSRVFRVHPYLALAVFPYGQAFHVTHHLFAMVPHHRLSQAHAILNRFRPYREQVVVCHGYFFRRVGTNGPSVLEVLSDRRGKASAHPLLRGLSSLRKSERSLHGEFPVARDRLW